MRLTTVFFDLETGGVEEKHPNIQLAAVAVREWKIVDTFERKILFNPAECDPAALTLNGYDAGRWAREGAPEAQVAQSFKRFLETYADLTLKSTRTGRPYRAARMAGHNVVAFDVPRLRAMMDRAGIGFWPGCWWYPLDTYQLAIWHYATHDREEAPENFTLQGLASHLDIPAQGAKHEALADVKLSAKIAEILVTGEG